MMKKSIIVCLIVAMLFAFAAPAAAEEITPSAELTYYTVLVLDTSGSHNFSSGGKRIYTADPAIDQVKEAAGKFSEAILNLEGNHYISLVTYDADSSTKVSFTNDNSKLQTAIKNLTAGGENVNVCAGLQMANSHLSDITNPFAVKNVVIFTTGMTNYGGATSSGKYNSDTPASEWYHETGRYSGKQSNEYYLYQYANTALNEAQKLHKFANVYSIGLFETWDDMPEAGQELVSFFKMFTEDLANPLENFTPVYDKSGINGAFERVCNGIIGNPFKDVTYSGYYFNAVLWAQENGITSGTDLYSFDPNEICTREQMVTFLWRAEGKTAPTITITPFTDLTNSPWSRDAILWATETKVTEGTGTTTFSPLNTVTREQVVTFLWRIAGEPEATATPAFTDIQSDNYSYNAIRWAAENGITVGTTPTTFSPQDPCTRGQIVTFLYRYYVGE